jgi:hypothetical protein
MILMPWELKLLLKLDSNWRWIKLDKFYELMQKIKERPNLYLGKKSLECLHSFVNGYIFCLYNQSGELCPDFLTDFQEYVQIIYSITSTQSWDRIISFYSTSDEEAFYKFFDLLDKFLKANDGSCSNSR